MAETKISEVLVGGLVLVVAAGFLAYSSGAIGLHRSGGSYDLHASFRSAEGIAVGTDVRLAGVRVGSVTGLALNPQTYFADMTISVQNGLELPQDTALLVSSEGLLGGNFMELVPGGMPMNLAAGDEIVDTQGSVSLISLLMKFVGGSASDALSGGAGADHTPMDTAPTEASPAPAPAGQ